MRFAVWRKVIELIHMPFSRFVFLCIYIHVFIYIFILILVVFDSFRDVKLTLNLNMLVIFSSFAFFSLIILLILVCRTFLWKAMLLKTKKRLIRWNADAKRGGACTAFVLRSLCSVVC